MIRLKKGLDIPITGAPYPEVRSSNPARRVALLGADYPSLKPKFVVTVGDRVKLGSVLFTDKKTPKIKFTSPGAGTVVEINRGKKRCFESIVIELSGTDEETFESFSEDALESLPPLVVIENLTSSGLWSSLRTRPFDLTPDTEKLPKDIFITATDSNPLSPSFATTLKGREKDLANGLRVLSRLTKGRLFFCKSPVLKIDLPALDSIVITEFTGPHPSGNVGTHIHHLSPVSREKFVWHISGDDVCDIGYLFTAGRINTERILTLAGPALRVPRIIKTRHGASIADLTEGELTGKGQDRVISGSVLSGRKAEEATNYLGRYHRQITAIPEGGEREFMGWLSPGLKLFSVKNVFLSRLFPSKKFDFTTQANGSPRAIVPVGSYELVMPLDILPTYLLRALASGDTEEAEKLGCLELTEEDLALCTYVCPSKIDHGLALRRCLDIIHKEG
ncbi:MAG: Na(+)-translocating NADH-quinone reductase subunit A [Deltaproteobacteria bacterium]|nr:Na(+)-translocating NADH-quinone reductase subunit A [Deltaproteobacteria bacterium]